MDAETGAILALQILALCSIAAALLAYLMRQSRNATDEYETRNKLHVLVTSCDTSVGLQIALTLYEAGYKVIPVVFPYFARSFFFLKKLTTILHRNILFVSSINCRIGICWSIGSFWKFTINENRKGDRTTERKGGGSDEHSSREHTRSGNTCSRSNRTIGVGLNEGGQFTCLFGCS